jgi:hypothetical protein
MPGSPRAASVPINKKIGRFVIVPTIESEDQSKTKDKVCNASGYTRWLLTSRFRSEADIGERPSAFTVCITHLFYSLSLLQLIEGGCEEKLRRGGFHLAVMRQRVKSMGRASRKSSAPVFRFTGSIHADCHRRLSKRLQNTVKCEERKLFDLSGRSGSEGLGR